MIQHHIKRLTMRFTRPKTAMRFSSGELHRYVQSCDLRINMPRIPLLLIAITFLSSGIAHFVATDYFAATIPDYISYHRELVIISGICEILGAIGILISKARLWAGYGLVALIIAVYPANINQALNPDRYPDIPALLLYIRLPIQFLLVWFVWWAIEPERSKSERSAERPFEDRT